MAKKNENNDWLWYVAIIILIAAIIYVAKYGCPICSSGTQDLFGGNNQQNKTDLSALFAPYVNAFHPQTSCSAAGGTWWNTPTKLGCFNTGVALDMSACADAGAQGIMAQCNAVGGTFVCNQHNVGCSYV